MSDESEGLPLAEALRAYGDPDLWAAYESARTALSRIPRRPPWLHSSREARDAWSDRYRAAQPAARHAADRAWAVLVADFTERLRSGELTATGIKVGGDDESRPIVITRYQWFDLMPDFTRSSARGRESEFVGVQVRRAPLDSLSDPGPANPVEEDRDELTGAVAEGTADPPPPVADTGRRRRGRPSLRKQIEAELERRAAQDQLNTLQAEEFRSLEAWAREEQKQGRLPNHHVPVARSIEKKLAKRYQELKEKKSMR